MATSLKSSVAYLQCALQLKPLLMVLTLETLICSFVKVTSLLRVAGYALQCSDTFTVVAGSVLCSALLTLLLKHLHLRVLLCSIYNWLFNWLN